MPVITEDIATTEPREALQDIGPPPPPTWDTGRGDGGRREDPESAFPISKAQLGLWLGLTAIAMLFAGLTSAYIVMRGAPSWQNVALPSMLWVTTFVLLASSVTIEAARHAIVRGALGTTKIWVVATAVLGLMFLLGQVAAWRQLVEVGVYLPTTIHSSFLYILTGVHALHVLGGLAVLAYVVTHTLADRYTASNHEPITLCATYWHFMDGLWLYLFLLLILA